ncbi:hypothetical protein WR25_14461 [Diploscapter pachys]|uniref:Uncharacterized protein n=1 Tax=Diploscapter pachys TaxID=2018661 RepID=A0A2A2LCU5_9BILA|nr:hypothetical protein WR25_14461 [Diploscapter pachys]
MSDEPIPTSTNTLSKPIPTTTTDSSPSNPHIKTITSEASENSNICDAVAIDIGTSKCKIAVCKERYIQIVEHEANRSVPSYIAYSEQREWLVGRMAENYAVCLQNVIYDVDSVYRSGDEDRDLVEVIQKDEIVKYYHAKLCENIEKARGVCKEIKPKFILLAGGSTRIPLISESLSGVFKDATICSFLNVDEAETSSNSSSQPQQKAAIGIDLGTTFSCVSVMENGRPFTIPNDHGRNTTPSVVAFDGDNVLTGTAATDSAVPPTNLVYDSKRLLGWQFKDEAVQAGIKTWPFKMADINGKPHYETAKGKTLQYIEPEFVSAEVLKHMKKTADKYFLQNNKVLRGAVVTVPAYFVDRQRQATMEAAKKAGINVLRLVTEPVAAAVAYSFQHTQTTKSTVLVYDLGGGTFDVTVAEIEGSRVIVKTISGNLHLGGQDFDKNLLDYVIETFKTETGVDLTDDTKKKALKRVRAAVVKAKESLSFREDASVHVEAVNNDQDLHIKLTREDMNRLNGDLFRGTMQVVDDAINKVEPAATVDNIDQVILVGGSTRIPMVQELLIQKFGKDKLRMNVNQDEAVAQGAAILANGLINRNSAISVTDVLPFTIGMAYRGMLMEEAFKKGTRYPCETVIHSETAFDNQTSVSQEIYQGERANCRLNIKLGQVTLDGLKRVPKGNKLETKFVIDENGMLNVTLTELATKKSSTIEISYDSEAAREDEEFRQRVSERNNVEDEVYQIQKTLESLKDSTEISAQTHEDLMKKIRSFLDWTDPLPELKDLRPRLKTLKQKLAQIITKNIPAGNMQ